MVLNGCTKFQQVNKLYPLWGKEVILKNGENQNRHIQIRQPQHNYSAEACILIVHGMNEYIGRYADIAQFFSDRYIVAGIDLTAHGLSNPVFRKSQNNIKAGNTPLDVSNAYYEQAQLRSLEPMRNDLELALNYLTSHCINQADEKKLPVIILSQNK